MKLLGIAVGGLVFVVTGSGGALADDASRPPEEPRPRGGYVPIDPSQADTVPLDQIAAGGAPCRLIYLNSCKNEPNQRCVVRAGFESSINDTSSIISGTRTITAFDYSDAVWDQVVQCVRDTYAPFDIDITDVDPGNVCHWENIVAGTPQEAGFGANTGGVSPWTSNCSIIQNSITYTFANVFGPNVVDICWTIAQETAHSFGLDHEYLQNDPMTYLSGSTLPGGFKRFQDVDASCGEFEPRPCECSATQNSVAMLTDIFGSASPSPPVITIDEPSAGESVAPGFVVRVTIEDGSGIQSATLEVDDVAVQNVTVPPFIFNAPDTLDDGTHRVRVRAIDSQGTAGASAAIDVVIGPPCETPADCAEQGPDLTCVGGRCVPGEGADGGLGDECEDDSNCFSGRCEHSTDGEAYCVEECELGGDDCPGGFDCIGGGVCWPADGGGGGCLSTSGTTPALPIGLGIVLGLFFSTRRRGAQRRG